MYNDRSISISPSRIYSIQIPSDIGSRLLNACVRTTIDASVSSFAAMGKVLLEPFRAPTEIGRGAKVLCIFLPSTHNWSTRTSCCHRADNRRCVSSRRRRRLLFGSVPDCLNCKQRADRPGFTGRLAGVRALVRYLLSVVMRGLVGRAHENRSAIKSFWVGVLVYQRAPGRR